MTAFAGTEQIRPAEPNIPVRYAPKFVIRGIATLACLGVACVDGARVKVVTAHGVVDAADTIVALVDGAQVTITAIELFADDADPTITAAIVMLAVAAVALLALATVPVRKRRVVAGTRLIVAINRAAAPVILTVGTKVLTAHAVDADVSAAARGSIWLRRILAPVADVIGIAGDCAACIVGVTNISCTRVAVVATSARVGIPAPCRAQCAECQ
jgi:hypothetical protein